MNVVVEFVPPVGVGVVLIVHAALGVGSGGDDPRTLGILGLVVHAGEEFHHVLLGVVHIVGTLALVPELVDGVDGPVAPGFPFGGGGRHFDAPAAVVADGGLVFIYRTFLGGHQDDAIGCTGAVDGCRRCILDDGDGGHVLGVDAVDAAFDAVDEHEGITAVDGGVASDVQRTGGTGVAAGSGDVESGD